MRAFVRSAALLVVTAAIMGSLVAVGAQTEKKGEYVGAEGCLCHADPIHKSWQASKHARAFELLKLAGQEKNDRCLPCHTTGYGQGGYGTEGVNVNLKGVQCEECHGPAAEHVDKMDKEKIVRTPSAIVCARCHMEKSIHERP